ncbi:unnamed protein product [Symbiodinium sp. CCMP2592]|nr:unnamed protein product [Symbiodinium sp. CCMP2592]
MAKEWQKLAVETVVNCLCLTTCGHLVSGSDDFRFTGLAVPAGAGPPGAAADESGRLHVWSVGSGEPVDYDRNAHSTRIKSEVWEQRETVKSQAPEVQKKRIVSEVSHRFCCFLPGLLVAL